MWFSGPCCILFMNSALSSSDMNEVFSSKEWIHGNLTQNVKKMIAQEECGYDKNVGLGENAQSWGGLRQVNLLGPKKHCHAGAPSPQSLERVPWAQALPTTPEQ